MMVILINVCVFANGCGYTTRSTLASHLKTIHIESFDNAISYTSGSTRNVYFPLLEVDARNAIIGRFQFDGNLRISESDQADLVLEGKLINYSRHGLRFTDGDDVEEYRVNVIVSLELWDTREEVLRWSESRFVGEATYFVTGPEATSEESAVEEAIEDLARRIVERTVEDW